MSCLLSSLHPSLPFLSLSAVQVSGEEERAPVPPPRRKRKKQRMQKQASLDELEVLPNFAIEDIGGFHGRY